MVINIGDYRKNTGVFCCFLPRPRPTACQTAVFGSKAAGNSFGTNGMDQELLASQLQTASSNKNKQSFLSQQTEMQWTSGTMKRLLVSQTEAAHRWC